ncbi:unnamed protein product [Paramecium sonneborni]|uniref:Uncharacterized protein n=1 Tax=Paramecium sonneborni TaxID=65129 RepID=A0A8S1LWN2_9CILI|nr:unnamed protein product [Paramecium sonneborni]
MSEQITPISINYSKEKLNKMKLEKQKTQKINEDKTNQVHLPQVNQNYNTPINNSQSLSFFKSINNFSEKKQNIQNINFQQQAQVQKFKKPYGLPRPQTSNGFIHIVLKNTQKENESIMMRNFNKKNQLQIIVDQLTNQYQNQKITLKYENRILIPEKSLEEQINQRYDTIVITFTINSETFQNEQQNNYYNSTVALLRKQQTPQYTYRNNNPIKKEDQSFRFKTEYCSSFSSSQNGFDFGILNSTKTDGNEVDPECEDTKRTNNYQTNKKSYFGKHYRQDQQHSADSQKMNNYKQNCRDLPKESLTRQQSSASIIQQISNQDTTYKKQQKLNSHRILSSSNFQTAQQKSELSKEQLQQKYSKQLNQIYQNNQNDNQNLFIKCQNCSYFCIVTQFHKQDYWCESCRTWSVKFNPEAIKIQNSCNHTLNLSEIITKFQYALQNRQLAKCCKQEIKYTIIKRIDSNKSYFNLRLELMVQMLKNQIIKIQTHLIAQCTETDCNFFTIWNFNQPLQQQGFCHSCGKRTAFYMESPQNAVIKSNCGHNITPQKLLGTASDAQLNKELAKCSFCLIQIPLKFYRDLGKFGSQYIDYAYNYQLDKLKQQFQKMTEIIVSNCSTLSCTFFYVFQNKTICDSGGKIVFSQQYNLDNQQIFSFCPNCHKNSISNQWNERRNIKKMANCQFANP